MTFDRSPSLSSDDPLPGMPMRLRGAAWLLAAFCVATAAPGGMAATAASATASAPVVTKAAPAVRAASNAAAAAARTAASAPVPDLSAIGDLSDPVRAVSQYKIDLWQTEQGLPLNTVQALLQSRDGGLWIGTGGGLARFDGKRFVSFDAARAPDVASQPVFALLEDRRGRLWIGHPNGVTVYEHGRFSPAVTKAQAGGRRIWSLVEDKTGAIWAAGDGGLVRWQDGAVKVLRHRGRAARRAAAQRRVRHGRHALDRHHRCRPVRDDTGRQVQGLRSGGRFPACAGALRDRRSGWRHLGGDGGRRTRAHAGSRPIGDARLHDRRWPAQRSP